MKMQRNKNGLVYRYHKIITVVVVALSSAVMGCAREEKVLEIKAPGTSVEVRKSEDGATIEVQGKKIEVEQK